MPPPPHPEKPRFPVLVALVYLPLVSIYLLYWPHVGYFVDDWFLLREFRAVGAGGPGGLAKFAAAAVQNNVYHVFRMHWLSLLYGCLVTWAGGYNVRFNFALLLLLHAAGSWLLCQALWRAGFERGLSFLAGALYLLAPTTHFGLFVNFTNPFIVLSTFWVLLMLWSFAGRLAGGSWGPGVVLFWCACAMAGLFRERSFGLLLHTGGSRPSVVADLAAAGALDRMILEIRSPAAAADARVAKTLAEAAKQGVETTILFPVSAGVNDRADAVRRVAEAASGAEMFVLKQYDPTHGHADAIFSRRAVVPHWRLHELAREAKPFFRDVRVRTRGFGEEAA